MLGQTFVLYIDHNLVSPCWALTNVTLDLSCHGTGDFTCHVADSYSIVGGAEACASYGQGGSCRVGTWYSPQSKCVITEEKLSQ